MIVSPVGHVFRQVHLPVDPVLPPPTSSLSLTDCGCPNSCTPDVLSRTATDSVASISCRDRIRWAMNNLDYTEEQACSNIGTTFPDSCGKGCDPNICEAGGTPPSPPPGPAPLAPPASPSLTDCGCSDSCTPDVLNRMATDDVASISCRDRIQWAMNNLDYIEEQACSNIGTSFPDSCGQGCDPNICGAATPPSPPPPSPPAPTTSSSTSVQDCGCPSSCTNSVLSQIAADSNGSFDCRSRIEWVMANTELTNEQDACVRVSSEFPSICGNGCDPKKCGGEGTPPGPPPGPPPASPPGPPLPPPGPGPEDGELVFAEEFDEGDQPNPAIWTYDQGDWGWGNAELQKYTNLKENVQISQDGKLVITAIRQGASITSGRIKTLNKFTLKYGRVEASIKVPDLRNGLWPAFWTLGNNFPQVGWPKCGEIDIMEMGNAAPGNSILNQQVGSAAHWFNDPEGRATYGLYLDTGEDLSQGFHTFSMDWTPDMITTYVDGNQIWAIDISPEKCPPEKCSEFHDFHFLLLNLAVGGSYTGLLSPAEITATFPARYEIDYIRVYANEWTEVGGSYITGGPTLKHDLTDCGCPATCTDQVLDLVAQDSNGNFSCRDRIEWVIGNLGATEGQACRTVSGEFLSICGQGCNPDAC
jgi:beta-glucanase (GH16 family)